MVHENGLIVTIAVSLVAAFAGGFIATRLHLPAIVGSNRTNPVTLPPGRGKLATNPLPTGSATMAKTIGIVRVCCKAPL